MAETYRSEAARLNSFANWQGLASPKKLAEAGFYYEGDGSDDIVKCFSCNVLLYKWSATDDPMTDHRQWSGRCRFVKGLPDNDILSYDVCGSGQDVCGNGDAANRRNTHPRFALYEDRLDSFEEAPYDHLRSMKESLALAGFFFIGDDEDATTACHCCGGCLENWTPDHDCWTRHAAIFPYCDFVRTIKGDEFVRAVKLDQRRSTVAADPKDACAMCRSLIPTPQTHIRPNV